MSRESAYRAELARLDARKNCRTGYACGETCIPTSKDCRKNPRASTGRERIRRIQALAAGEASEGRGLGRLRQSEAGGKLEQLQAQRQRRAQELLAERRQKRQPSEPVDEVRKSRENLAAAQRQLLLRAEANARRESSYAIGNQPGIFQIRGKKTGLILGMEGATEFPQRFKSRKEALAFAEQVAQSHRDLHGKAKGFHKSAELLIAGPERKGGSWAVIMIRGEVVDEAYASLKNAAQRPRDEAPAPKPSPWKHRDRVAEERARSQPKKSATGSASDAPAYRVKTVDGAQIADGEFALVRAHGFTQTGTPYRSRAEAIQSYHQIHKHLADDVVISGKGSNWRIYRRDRVSPTAQPESVPQLRKELKKAEADVERASRYTKADRDWEQQKAAISRYSAAERLYRSLRDSIGFVASADYPVTPLPDDEKVIAYMRAYQTGDFKAIAQRVREGLEEYEAIRSGRAPELALENGRGYIGPRRFESERVEDEAIQRRQRDLIRVLEEYAANPDRVPANVRGFIKTSSSEVAAAGASTQPARRAGTRGTRIGTPDAAQMQELQELGQGVQAPTGRAAAGRDLESRLRSTFGDMAIADRDLYRRIGESMDEIQRGVNSLADLDGLSRPTAVAPPTLPTSRPPRRQPRRQPRNVREAGQEAERALREGLQGLAAADRDLYRATGEFIEAGNRFVENYGELERQERVLTGVGEPTTGRRRALNPGGRSIKLPDNRVVQQAELLNLGDLASDRQLNLVPTYAEQVEVGTPNTMTSTRSAQPRRRRPTK